MQAIVLYFDYIFNTMGPLYQQTDVWLQAHLSGDEDTLAANQLSSELSYRGTLPVVVVVTNTATYQVPVEWRAVSSLYNIVYHA